MLCVVHLAPISLLMCCLMILKSIITLSGTVFLSLFLYTVLSVLMALYLLLCISRVLEQHIPHFQPVPLLLHAICLFLHRVRRICRCKKGIVNFSNANDVWYTYRAELFNMIYERLVGKKKLIQSFLKISFCENII